MKRLILTGLLGLSLAVTTSFADYNKGFKYYQKYFKREWGIGGPTFIKILGIEDESKLDEIFKDKEELKKTIAKKLREYYINRYKKRHHKEPSKKAVENLNKDIDKFINSGKFRKFLKKRKDIEDFLKGVMEGKVPAGCS